MPGVKQQRKYCGAIINQNVPQKNDEIYCIRLFRSPKKTKNTKKPRQKQQNVPKLCKIKEERIVRWVENIEI